MVMQSVLFCVLLTWKKIICQLFKDTFFSLKYFPERC